MAAAPKNNLPSDSQPWARYVEDRIKELNKVTAVTESASSSALKAISSSATQAAVQQNRLSDTIAHVNEQDVTIESIGATADGKNTITRSTDPAPVGPTDGVDGDLWQQFSGTQIVAQWTHDGTEYVSATLSHQVISSIDLGTATVGALTGAVIQTAASGARIELTADHFRKYDASENIEVDMPVGGAATFSGVITGSDIVGSTIKTAATGNRIEIYTEPGFGVGHADFHSGLVGETKPGSLVTEADSDVSWKLSAITLINGEISGDPNRAQISVFGTQHETDPVTTSIYVHADKITFGLGTDGTSFLLQSGRLSTPNDDGSIDVIEPFGSATTHETPIVLVHGVENSIERDGLLTTAVSGLVPTTQTPLIVWDASATLGENLQYTVDGTTWNVYGGGGSSGWPPFADPGSDKIVFWDDSAGTWAALTPSTGLVVTSTDMTVRTASTAQTGIVELATDAETIAGTDTSRAITPAGLRADAESKPIVSVGMSAARNYTTSAALQAMTWDAEDFDTHAMHSAVTNTSRLTCVKAGYYNITGKCTTAVTDVGWTIITLYKNGVAQPKIKAGYGPATGSYTRPLIAGLIYLDVGDYVELYLQSSAPSASAILIAESFFAAEFIRP